MVKREFNFSSEITGVSKLKEDEILISEIILNALGSRSNYWLTQSQILENASRRVYLSEDITMIWNDTKIAAIDRLNDLVKIPYTQIVNALLAVRVPGLTP